MTGCLRWLNLPVYSIFLSLFLLLELLFVTGGSCRATSIDLAPTGVDSVRILCSLVVEIRDKYLWHCEFPLLGLRGSISVYLFLFVQILFSLIWIFFLFACSFQLSVDRVYIHPLVAPSFGVKEIAWHIWRYALDCTARFDRSVSRYC